MKGSIMKINRFTKGYASNSPLLNCMYVIVSLGILIGVWFVASNYIGVDVAFPKPSIVANKFIDIVRTDTFWITVYSTFRTCVITFLIALTSGVFLGVLAGFFKPLFYMLQPLVAIIKTTPVISIILLALIWFREITPNFVGFLITFPVVYNNVIEGVRNIDKELVDMAKMYRVKKISILKDIYLSSIASYVFAAISIGWGMTIKAVVAAEVLSQPAISIGTSLQEESMFLETAGVFAWTIVIIIMSFSLEMIFRTIQNRFERWR